jgi:hypothetical protein
MQKHEAYKGFTLSWEDPPTAVQGWLVTITSHDLAYRAMIVPGAEVVAADTLAYALAKARSYVRCLLR